MVQPKTLYDAIKPLIVANFIVGLGIWPGETIIRKTISIGYSVFCLIIFGVLIKLSMSYFDETYQQRLNEISNRTFQAVFYTNIAMTLCLIITSIWRIKVDLKSL
ncbi:hypothetical protein EAI_01064 [Harpegnathos saltator]|uniref:Uncharacterized protein n=1 Tax=Harpegnathos saltator TaxID=610380 RepID=E2BL97_HARSA|nr:hypothetical protein EAI_01064 [Harpegnathos saltator]